MSAPQDWTPQLDERVTGISSTGDPADGYYRGESPREPGQAQIARGRPDDMFVVLVDRESLQPLHRPGSCCSMMAEQLTRECRHHSRWDCPDILVNYWAHFTEYGLIINSTESIIGIQYCPWCGAKLPESRREAVLAARERAEGGQDAGR